MAARNPERRPGWVAIPFFYHQMIFPQSNDMRITTVGGLSFGAGFGSPGALAFRQSCGMPWHLALEGWLVEMVGSIDGDTQQMDGLYWKILLKWVIWGYSYFKKPPKQSPTCQMHRSLYKTKVPTVRSIFQISSILWGHHGASADEVSATWAKFQVSEILSFTQMLQMDEKPKLRSWRMNQTNTMRSPCIFGNCWYVYIYIYPTVRFYATKYCLGN